MKSKGTKYFNKLFFIQVAVNLITIAALLVIIELTLRYFNTTAPPQAFEPHPTLYWKLSSNLRNFNFEIEDLSCLIDTNADGFRNEKLEVARNDRSFRILCLGDESTFGTGVKQSDTYSKILQANIRKRYHFFITEVINAGVEGYSSYQGVRFLKEYCLKYKPDVIVVAYMHNDVSLSPKPDNERISANPLAVKVKKELYKLQIFMTLRNFILGELYERVQKDQDSGGVQRVSPGDYRKNMEEIASLAKSINARCIFLNLQESKKYKEPPNYRRNLKKVAEKNGNWLDVYSDFQLNPEYYISGSYVPSKAGHKVIGEKLFALIKSKSMIPQRPGGKAGTRAPGVPIPPGGEAPPPPGGKIGTPKPGEAPPPGGKKPSGGEQPQQGPGHPPGSDNFYF